MRGCADLRTKLVSLLLVLVLAGVLASGHASAAPKGPIDEITESLVDSCKNMAAAKAWAQAIETRPLNPSESETAWQAVVQWEECVSFLSGFTYGYIDGSSDAQYTGNKICFPPQRMSGEQLGAVFVAWADRHPELWHQTSDISIHAAFSEAWPCTH